MNGQQRRAILCGNSLILEAVRASLEKCLGLEVVLLDRPLEKPLEELGAYCPAVVIFDAGAIPKPGLLCARSSSSPGCG